MELKNKRVLVVGMGKSGLAASLFAAERGALTVATDIKQKEELGISTLELDEKGIRVVAGKHILEDFTSSDIIVASPGVPLNIYPLKAARDDGKLIIGEIELASLFLKGTIIGITGSNGKSTTTSLTAWILSCAGIDCRACGNIGLPLIEMVAADSQDKFYSVELSSYQLEAIESFKPHIALLLNLSPDHLDRYESYAHYIAAKGTIFKNQIESDYAILNREDSDSKTLEEHIKAQKLYFSSMHPVEKGAFIKAGNIYLKLQGKEEYLIALDEIPLPGMHNVENVMAAALAARVVGIKCPIIRAAVMSFKGLPHRLEHVAEIRGISFYNDSKATNVDSAIKAIQSFPGKKIVLILGGRDKGGDFTRLIPLIQDNVKEVILIGEATEKIKGQIEGSAPIYEASSLADGVKRGFKTASAGEIVLLAPGCASFDAYRNYEERGDDFRRNVLELMEELGDA
ncbi:MAG: UDP-N-acetylmuramoyl-L-alanine--D-glutamate ligase [Acidobacteriota bacterium]